jgi:hypothetical protein
MKEDGQIGWSITYLVTGGERKPREEEFLGSSPRKKIFILLSSTQTYLWPGLGLHGHT